MPKFISDEIKKQVCDLKKQGVSNREISRLLHLSRVFIAYTIKNFKPKKIVHDRRFFPRIDDYSSLQYSRCQECGAMVQLPCFACSIRNTGKAPLIERDENE
jgi:predicted transcriptional regulator